ncbi:flagellar hook-basal body protein [Halobacillus salinarum]|uniref:Flagellar hook-basal body protein n=1 Tax=Halobacillus salinarum TaxID=2932257 RepID=A0ABY4ELP2_9BACI|nr:flagellar hook-basal body protein [Halobacillus salinarum]UOQ45368.1 flagellar hook-basal body protein [Halobacillus salinarum]
MLRGFYTAASGMMANQRRQETLSNNMSNAYTPGYKADQGTMRAFPEMLLKEIGSKQIPTANGLNLPINKTVGSLNTGVYMQETVPDFSQGDVRETGIGTDLALINGPLPDENGAVFFNVQNENGELRYTRNGNFTVDGEGFLTTNQGYYVLDANGNPVQTGGMDFNVAEDGTLTVAGRAIPLGLSYTANANQLIKNGSGLFEPGEDADALVNARTTTNVKVQQGALEGSNVDPAKTMTEMMNTYRSFEMNQRVLKAYDQSLEKAVTEIARVR